MSLAALSSEARDGGLDLEPLRETLSRRGILIAARRIRTGDEAAFPDQPAATGVSARPPARERGGADRGAPAPRRPRR